MYEVKIINDGNETIINVLSTDIKAPRLLSGSIKYGINTIDNFTFIISMSLLHTTIGLMPIAPLLYNCIFLIFSISNLVSWTISNSKLYSSQIS